MCEPRLGMVIQGRTRNLGLSTTNRTAVIEWRQHRGGPTHSIRGRIDLGPGAVLTAQPYGYALLRARSSVRPSNLLTILTSGSTRSERLAYHREACGIIDLVPSCCEQQIGWLPIAMQYTPGQLRRAAGIPQETYRHWKKTLQPLRRRTGHSPSFTAGDMLAVVLVRTLSVDFAIRVSSISSVAEELFTTCNAASWPTLERSCLLVDIPNRSLQLSQDVHNTNFDVALLVIPLKPVVDRIHHAFLSPRSHEFQETLRFPPTSIPSTPSTISTGGRP